MRLDPLSALACPLLALLTVGCAAAPAEVKPPAPLRTVVAVRSVPTTTTTTLPEPPPASTAEPDVTTAPGVAEFFARLCTHAASHDGAWVRSHSLPTLAGNVPWAKDDAARLLLAGLRQDDAHETLAAAREVRSACDVLRNGAARDMTDADGAVLGVFGSYGESYRFSILRDGDVPRLAEISWEQLPRPVPVRTKKRRFTLQGDVTRATDPASGKSVARFVRETITHEPGCIHEEANVDDMSSAMLVRVTKAPKRDARVRVYASNLVSASLVACVQTQLARVAKADLDDGAFDAEYLLRVIIEPWKPRTETEGLIMRGPGGLK